ncbi:hypothetical protein B0H19DRAFT_1253031 [Mycena capillaripes]|nr:hypothetical protein B0H19DRAFT_1253031 [Mycena capillaripes]
MEIVYFDLLSFVVQLVQDPSSLALIEKTAGVRIMITRAWRLQINGRGDTPIAPLLNHICLVLGKLHLTRNASDLEEVSDGAGGTLVEFMKLITQYVDLLVPTTRSPVTLEIHQYLDPIFTTTNRLHLLDLKIGGGAFRYSGPHVATRNGSISGTDNLLGAALLRVRECCFQLPLQHLVFGQIIAAGVFHALVGYAIRSVEVEFTQDLLRLLSLSTVYFSVLSQIETGIKDAEDLLADPAFAESEVFSTWTALRTLAEERISLAKSWQLSGRGTRRACDNMECGHIGLKVEFRCCGHCKAVYYCSAICQRVDWKRGDHRSSCSSLRAFGLRNHDPLGSMDLSFMCALLHHDYQINKAEVIREQVAFLREHPSEAPYMFTVFDYSPGRMCIKVQNVYPWALRLPKFKGVNCPEHVARALSSGGRMDMHLAASADVPHAIGFSDIARRCAPAGGRKPEPTDLSSRIEQLLEATSAVLEIH